MNKMEIMKTSDLHEAGTWLRSSRLLLVLSLGLLAVALFPLTLARIMPLADYPNHIARIYILQHAAQSPMLARYYIPFIHFQPNLAFDLAVLWLGKLFPLWTAGKIFAGITFAVIVSGAIALNRVVHGRWSLWPCLTFLLLYNRLFLWGFIGYMFTLGLALWGLAAWFAVRKRNPATRIAVGGVFAFAIYIGHLFAFGFYGLVVAVDFAYRNWARYRTERPAVIREAAVTFAQFVVPLLVFFLVSPTGEAGSLTRWTSVFRPLTAPFNIVQNYNLPLDVATFLIFCGLFAYLYFRKRLLVPKPLFAAFLALAAVHLVMPDRLFSSYGADHRLPIAIALFAVAVTHPVIRAPRAAAAVAVGLVGLFLARTAVIAQVWSRADSVYRPYEEALAKLPQGARLSAIVMVTGATWLPDIPKFEIDCLAIMLRDAFVANVFAYPKDAGQSIALTPAVLPTQNMTGYHFSPMDIEYMQDPKSRTYKWRPLRPAEWKYYDYYLIVNPGDFSMPIPPNIRLQYRGPDFNIYRVDHAASHS